MTITRYAPTALSAQVNLAGAYTQITNDPDTPDGNWLSGTDNNQNQTALVDFATPAEPPSTPTDEQEFKVWVRRDSETQTGEPSCTLELWENGALVRAGTPVTITGTGQMVTFLWAGSELATSDGSLVQCNIVGTKSGGAPGSRNVIEVNALEWNSTEGTAPPSFTPKASGRILTGMF